MKKIISFMLAFALLVSTAAFAAEIQGTAEMVFTIKNTNDVPGRMFRIAAYETGGKKFIYFGAKSIIAVYDVTNETPTLIEQNAVSGADVQYITRVYDGALYYSNQTGTYKFPIGSDGKLGIDTANMNQYRITRTYSARYSLYIDEDYIIGTDLSNRVYAAKTASPGEAEASLTENNAIRWSEVIKLSNGNYRIFCLIQTNTNADTVTVYDYNPTENSFTSVVDTVLWETGKTGNAYDMLAVDEDTVIASFKPSSSNPAYIRRIDIDAEKGTAVSTDLAQYTYSSSSVLYGHCFSRHDENTVIAWGTTTSLIDISEDIWKMEEVYEKWNQGRPCAVGKIGNTYYIAADGEMRAVSVETYKNCTVTFVDEDGNTISSVGVKNGDSVSLPTVRRGYYTTTSNLSNIQSDMTVVCKYHAGDMVDAKYDFEDMKDIVADVYSQENGWVALKGWDETTDDDGNTVKSYIYGDVVFDRYGISQSAYVIRKENAKSDSYTSETGETLPFIGIQGNSGFKNVTAFSIGNNLGATGTHATSVNNRIMTNAVGTNYSTSYLMNIQSGTNPLYHSLNLYTEPAVKYNMEYGFKFCVVSFRSTTNETELKNIDSATKAGGFGEIKDSSIHGQINERTHYSDDKAVKARLDATYGYAVYNENTSAWQTIATAEELGTEDWHSLKYVLDPVAKTYTIYLDGAEKGTFPYSNAESITAIDGIEFNAMRNSDGACFGTSIYYIDDVYAYEGAVNVTFKTESGRIIKSVDCQIGDLVTPPEIEGYSFEISDEDAEALKSVSEDMTVIVTPSLNKEYKTLTLESTSGFNAETGILSALYSGYGEDARITAFAYDVSGIEGADVNTAFVDNTVTPVVAVGEKKADGSVSLMIDKDFSGKIIFAVGGTGLKPGRMLIDIPANSDITVDSVTITGTVAGGKVEAEVMLTNNTETAFYPAVILASYEAEEDGQKPVKLTDIDNGKLEGKASRTYKATLELTNANADVRLFIWKGMDNVTPLRESMSVGK